MKMCLDASIKPGVIIIEGHVQGLANLRLLAEEGIPAIVVDKNDCIARHSKYCQAFYRCPDFIEDDFAEFLMQLAVSQNLYGWLLLPSNDHAVYTLARHQRQLQTVFKMLTPQLPVFETIYDKSRLLELAKLLGIPMPQTAYFTSLQPGSIDLRFPVITKGKRGLTFYKKVGKKAILAADESQLRQRLNSLAELIALDETFTQEVIPFDGSNKTISFTSFCVDGEIKTFWMGVKLREHPLQFGTATFCESVYQQECFFYSNKLLQTLHYTGVSEIEYLRDPRDGLFKLIEINARTWLWVGLAAACGVNYPLFIYKHVNGLPNDFPTSYQVDIRWRNFWTDTIFSSLAIFKGNLRIQDYLQSVRGDGLIDAVRDKEDPRPFWMMTKMLFKLAKKR